MTKDLLEKMASSRLRQDGTDTMQAILLRVFLCPSRHTVSNDNNDPLKTDSKDVCLQANGSLMEDNGTMVAPTTTGERMVERGSATLCQHTTMADVTQYLLEKLASSRLSKGREYLCQLVILSSSTMPL